MATTKNIATVDEATYTSGMLFLVATNGTVKKVAITIPTKTSDLTNDSNFITKAVEDLTNYYLKTETYTKTEVNNLVSSFNMFVPVDTLPTASADTLRKIYLVPSSDPKTQNVKDEYITIDNGESATTRYTWEKIGSTAVDLSGYYTKTEVDDLLDDKVDKVSGKGLSTNDYTTTEKNKLSGIETGATNGHKGATTLPATLVANEHYVLGSISSLTFVLPATATYNDEITIDFDASASFTPTTSSTIVGDSLPTTVANKHYTFGFAWNGTNWAFYWIAY